MKIAVFSLTYWDTEQASKDKAHELTKWLAEIKRCCNPDFIYLASGTFSNPAWNPIDVPIINAELDRTHPHDYKYWCYAAAAETAGFWYAILNTDADIIIQACTDCIINHNMRQIAEELTLKQNSLVAAPAWCTLIDDAFCYYKRKAVITYLHQRRRANLIEPNNGNPPITEQEKTDIFKDTWWNPWPTIGNMRQDWKVGSCAVDGATIIAQRWPVVIRPAPDVEEAYRALR